jgi:hypothetical protein
VKLPKWSLDNLGTTGGWNVPSWNIPAAKQFSETEKVMKTAYEKLRQLEEQIDNAERQKVADEMGDKCEPADARFAKARFESEEWHQVWKDFTEAVLKAQQLEQQWREEIKETQTKPTKE